MRNRPWPLLILGLVQLLTPVGNILFNAWSYQVPPRYVLGWLLERSGLEIFESLALMPIAGLAILMMKRWSYPIFFIAMLWSIVANLRNFSFVAQTVPLTGLIVLYALEIALVIYFLIPSVRKTYFDATVRWWESKPRYDLGVEGSILAHGKKSSITVINVSEGGALISGNEPLAVGELLEMSFNVVGMPFSTRGKIVYARAVEGSSASASRGYGVQFIHTSEAYRDFRRLSKGLGELGLPDRAVPVSLGESFRRWIVGVVTSGKGFVPEFTPRRDQKK